MDEIPICGYVTNASTNEFCHKPAVFAAVRGPADEFYIEACADHIGHAIGTDGIFQVVSLDFVESTMPKDLPK